MTWVLAAAAAISATTAYVSSASAASASAKAAGRASRAEGEAIVRERLNKTVSNSYSTAFAQMQLSLQKRQLAQQKADVSAAALAAKGAVQTEVAASGSIGASVQAVASDIEQKAAQAADGLSAEFENALLNYNNELEMMVLNTDQSTPQIRKAYYDGPSAGQMLGAAALSGLAQFASGYALRRMNLGLGTPAGQPSVPSSSGGGLYALPTTGIKLGGY